MNKKPGKNKDPIDNLKPNMFHQVRFPKMDSLTIFIPENQKPSPEVQRIVDEAGSSRWFPQKGGHLVKIPNVFDTYDEKLFKIEKVGWDHEHCFKCGGTIDSDISCWVAELKNRQYLFCNSCYLSLKHKSKP